LVLPLDSSVLHVFTYRSSAIRLREWLLWGEGMSISSRSIDVWAPARKPAGDERAARPHATPADYVSGGTMVWLIGSAFYLQGGETRPLGELLVLAAFIWVTLGVGRAGVRSGRRS
jgi:hypothetical protein